MPNQRGMILQQEVVKLMGKHIDKMMGLIPEVLDRLLVRSRMNNLTCSILKVMCM